MRDATWQAIPRSKGNTLQTHSLSQGASGPTSSQHNLSLLQTNGMIPEASCPFDEQPDLQKWVMTVLCPDMRESDFDPSDWGPLTLSDLGNCTVCLAPAVYPDIILPTTLLLPHRPATSAPQQPWATTEPPLPRDDRRRRHRPRSQLDYQVPCPTPPREHLLERPHQFASTRLSAHQLLRDTLLTSPASPRDHQRP